MTTALDRSIQRLLETFPPKHPDRRSMRPEERRRERQQRTNARPIVTTNGWQGKVGGTVDWKKQDSIPVGTLDRGIWADPPKRAQHVPSGKGRGNKGKKNSG